MLTLCPLLTSPLVSGLDVDRHHALTAIGRFAPSLPSKQLVDVRESKGFSFVFFRNFKVKTDSAHYVQKERWKEGKTKAVSLVSQSVSQTDYGVV